MAGFDENVAVMGEWVPRSRIPGSLFSSSIGEEKSSKRVLERELSLNHGQVIGLQEDTTGNYNKASTQTNISRGGLGERIAARAGFNAPRLNTENMRNSNDFSIDSSLRSPCLTISSPGLSPATLLESPVFLSNPLVSLKLFAFRVLVIIIEIVFLKSFCVTFAGSTVSNYREVPISSWC